MRHGVPGVPGGARVVPEGAHVHGVDECIYGVYLKARVGQGRARTVPEPVPDTVPEPVP